MENLKGVDEINKILNEFLEPYECTAEMGSDFCYWCNSYTINYSLIVSERMDKLFMQYAKSIGLIAETNIFILSFLHELYHSLTIDDIDDEDYFYSQDVKATLGDSDEDCFIYFNLPDEYAATSGAVDYINSHEVELKIWWNTKLQPAIQNFYKINEVA